MIDYIGNDMADQGAKMAAQHMAFPSTIRRPMDANLYLVKAYQRRLVAINAHCLRNFPVPKAPKRKPVKRQAFAERLRELILSSEHPHVYYHEDTQKWHCTHCPMVLRTFPLYEHLRRTKTCPKVLGVLGQHQRLDRPLPLFMRGPPRQEGPQPPVTLTLHGVTTHASHRLAFYRGLYICLRCGHMAHTEVHKLKNACHAPPTCRGYEFKAHAAG